MLAPVVTLRAMKAILFAIGAGLCWGGCEVMTPRKAIAVMMVRSGVVLLAWT